MSTFAAGSILNLGPEEIIQANGTPITVSGYSVPSFVDWNNDGLNDLVVGEGGGGFTGKVRIYLNVGTDSDPQFVNYSYAKSGNSDLTCNPLGCMGCFPRVVYWDADDRKDLLVGLADGTIKIYLNIGTEESPIFNEGTTILTGSGNLNVGARATPAFVDWDNNTMIDLVVGGLDGKIHVYFNCGCSGSKPPLFNSSETAGYSVIANNTALIVPSERSSPVIMDYDGDGKKDILTGNTNGQLLFYKNVGTDTEPTFANYELVESNGVQIDLAGMLRSRPSVCYWNGKHDGYLDVLIGYGDSKIHLYRGKPMAGDIDGDGDIDSTDFTYFAICWFGAGTDGCKSSDLNSDGVVNWLDLQIFANIWLEGTE
jgi:hypothetical protein